MPTVHEILKATGMTDDQIAAIDAKAIGALGKVIETADRTAADGVAKAQAELEAARKAQTQAQADFDAAKKARDEAELAQRSNVEFYETKITPALAGWDEQKRNLETARANAEAKSAFYERQIEGAKSAGYLPADNPAFVLPTVTDPAQRDGQGRFVAGAPGSVAGSPTFVTPEQHGDRLAMLADIAWEYSRLNGGAPIPIPPTQLVEEAAKMKLDPRSYAERHFNFAQKRQELAEKQRNEERAQIAAEAVKPWEEKMAALAKESDERLKAREREWAEKFSSNPDTRLPVDSKFSDVARAVKNNERPDPLNLTEQQRRSATHNAIHTEITQNSAV